MRLRHLVVGGSFAAVPVFVAVVLVAGFITTLTTTMGARVAAQQIDCGQPLPVGSSALVSPMAPGTYNVSSGFGARDGAQHRGVDFAAPAGTPIYAAAAGTVVRAGDASGFGKWIVIDHRIDGKRVSTVYGHMWPQGVNVSVGQRVEPGQPIARVGSNGQSTGPHLHFEVWQGGRFGGGRAVDPMTLLHERPKPSPEPQRPPSSNGRPTMEELMPREPQTPQRHMPLTREQQRNADAIVAVGKGMQIPPRGWVIAVATALQESTLLVYANAGNPTSLQLPHQAVGSDHDSVGLFQQRASWGSTRERMNPATSARLFYEALLEVPGWQTMSLAEAAQTVQRSAFPDAYAKWEIVAVNAVRAAHGVAPIGDAPTRTC